MNKNLAKFLWGSCVRMTLLLLAVSTVSFILITSSPIDPIDAYIGSLSVTEEQYQNIAAFWGLDKPPLERFGLWLYNLAHGDLGLSLVYRQPVLQIIMERFQTSLALMGMSWCLSGALGFTFGVLSGANRGTIFDKVIKTLSLLFASTPVFWLGLLLLVIFAVELQWFPWVLQCRWGCRQKKQRGWIRRGICFYRR